MATVAEQLHTAREARHLTVEQVAEITKIRTDHLRALEQGNFKVFAAPVYIRGFVRKYSAVLKLDVAQVMATLEAELGQGQKSSDAQPLAGHPRGILDFLTLQLSKVGWQRAVVWLGLGVVAIVLIVVIAWRQSHGENSIQGLKPAKYQPRTSGEMLPLPTPKR